jgi:hypothetical protein
VRSLPNYFIAECVLSGPQHEGRTPPIAFTPGLGKPTANKNSKDIQTDRHLKASESHKCLWRENPIKQYFQISIPSAKAMQLRSGSRAMYGFIRPDDDDRIHQSDLSPPCLLRLSK